MQAAPEPRSDLLGAALSGVCMVHCVSTPGLLVVAPAAASALGGFHPLLLILVTAVAGWSFVPGFRRHGDGVVICLAGLGLTLLGIAAFAFDESALETLLSVAGAALMMFAHLRNRASSRTRAPSA